MAGRGFRFNYPEGNSPVFYIGQASNLRRRLNEHLKWASEARDTPNRRYNLYHPRYEYAAKFNPRYTYIRTWQNVTPKDLEDIILARFAWKYLSFPVTNGQGAWRRIEQQWKEFGG